MENSGKSALGLDTNVAAGLAYLPICGVSLIMSIIIIVTDKTNKLARFSAFQSLLLTAFLIVGYVAGVAIIGVGAAANIGALAILGFLVYIAAFFIFLIAMIICCIQGFMGKQFKLPIIGGMADNWSN
ncbi:MAG: hypothetical protein WBC19_09530 [Pyrinomonadaceae bacterium]|jgi:uncharacterized membrane protein|nr:hypothetical protein [Chloracidobacterium sp.]HRI04461.1 hypothetical protein [Pyrinomonadaceae bacterium]